MDEEVEEIRLREAKLAPERKTVIEGPALQLVEQQNKLNRGLSEVYDITPDIDKGKPGGYLFEPDSLRLSPAELQKRYDPQTWADFQAWAHKTEVEPGTTVWQWMGGKKVTQPPKSTAKKKPAKKAPSKPKARPAPKPKAAPKAAPSLKPQPPVAPPEPPKRTVAGIEAALGVHVTRWKQFVAERDALRAAKTTAWTARDWQALQVADDALNTKNVEIDQWLESSRDAVSIPTTERGQVVVTTAAKSVRAVVAKGAALTERYTHADLMPRVEAKYYAGRAHHSKGVISINAKTSPSVVMHEITHAIEQQASSVLVRSLAFLKHRAGDEPLQSLRKLTGLGYKPYEMAFEDHFAKRGGSHYMGKSYGGRATELLTMGVERLHRDPLEFLVNDQEYFRFVIETLQLL